MENNCINTAKDSIVAEVVQKLQSRSEVGLTKYGTTLDREDLTLADWLNHAQEEAFDLSLYLTKLKRIVESEDDNIIELKNKFDDLVRECINQKHEIATKDRIIDNLNKVIKSQEEEIKDLNNIINPAQKATIEEDKKEVLLVRKRRAWHY